MPHNILFRAGALQNKKNSHFRHHSSEMQTEKTEGKNVVRGKDRNRRNEHKKLVKSGTSTFSFLRFFRPRSPSVRKMPVFGHILQTLICQPVTRIPMNT